VGTKGRIVTVEVDKRLKKEIKKNFEKAGVKNIELIIGDVKKVLKKLEENFDLIFMDIWKDDYLKVLEDCVRLLKNGGILVTDNALWDDPAVEEYRKAIKSHPKLESMIIAIEDGLAVSIKK
jgi:predicted O-methyltransferase YrrM